MDDGNILSEKAAEGVAIGVMFGLLGLAFFGLAAVTYCLRTSAGLGRVLNTPVMAPMKGTAGTAFYHPSRAITDSNVQTVGEYVFWILYVSAILAYILIRVGLDGWTTRMARLATGGALLYQVMFVSISAAHQGLFQRFGLIPFERMVRHHRGMGYLCFQTMVAHLLLQITTRGPTTLRSLEPVGVRQVRPLFGLLAYLSFWISVVVVLPPIRRKAYELFYAVHAVMTRVAMVLVPFHAPDSLPVMLLTLCAWAVALALRFWGPRVRRFEGEAVTMRADGEYVLLELELKGAAAGGAHGPDGCGGVPLATRGPGDWAFISIASISRISRQPFSLACAPEARRLRFLIKDMGVSSFTGRLRALALSPGSLPAPAPTNPQSSLTVVPAQDSESASSPSGAPLPTPAIEHGGITAPTSVPGLVVWARGPYGKLSLNLPEYSHLCLLAGGVGITPMLSTFLHLAVQAKRGSAKFPRLLSANLVWVVRRADSLAWLAALLTDEDGEGTPLLSAAEVAALVEGEAVTFGSAQFKVSLFATGGKGTPGAGVPPHQTGRPDVNKLVALAADAASSAGSHAAALVCGPEALVFEALTVGKSLGVDVHRESFMF